MRQGRRLEGRVSSVWGRNGERKERERDSLRKEERKKENWLLQNKGDEGGGLVRRGRR